MWNRHLKYRIVTLENRLCLVESTLENLDLDIHSMKCFINIYDMPNDCLEGLKGHVTRLENYTNELKGLTRL